MKTKRRRKVKGDGPQAIETTRYTKATVKDKEKGMKAKNKA